MQKIKAAINLAKNLRTTGAVTQTSRRCQREMCSNIDPNQAQTIVEFGAGPGNITREILDTMHAESRLYTFEVSKEFCDKLENEISDARMQVVNDGAQNLDLHVKDRPDVIISSLPLTIFSKDLRNSILQLCYERLPSGSYFSQVMYSKIHKGLLSEIFETVNITTLLSIPIENVYHCQKA